MADERRPSREVILGLLTPSQEAIDLAGALFGSQSGDAESKPNREVQGMADWHMVAHELSERVQALEAENAALRDRLAKAEGLLRDVDVLPPSEWFEARDVYFEEVRTDGE